LFKVIFENGTNRKLTYGFLFTFHSNYGLISYRFRDTMVENRDVFHTALHSTPRPIREGGPVGLVPYRLAWKSYGVATRW